VTNDAINPRMLKSEAAKEILAELFDIRTHEVDEMIRQAEAGKPSFYPAILRRILWPERDF